MSDNVSIKEGARAYNFTVDKLRTAQQGSDEPVIWVPESTVQLGSLRASDNGVYLAAAEDLYGYGEIVVSVNGAATIGDRAVFPDDSGQLHEEYLPHAIVIVTPPRKLEYEDGQQIDLRGLVVKAVDANGNTWTNAKYPNGHIPLQELIIDPDHADKDDEHSTITVKDSQSTPPDLSPAALSTTRKYYKKYDNGHGYAVWLEGPGPIYTSGFYLPSGDLLDTISASRSPFVRKRDWSLNPEQAQEPESGHNATKYTLRDGTTAYADGILSTELNTTVPTKSISGHMGSYLSYCNMVFCGEMDDKVTETITVSWARYGDKAILSTSFDITMPIDDGFSAAAATFKGGAAWQK